MAGLSRLSMSTSPIRSLSMRCPLSYMFTAPPFLIMQGVDGVFDQDSQLARIPAESGPAETAIHHRATDVAARSQELAGHREQDVAYRES
jgi:hypothetical protein